MRNLSLNIVCLVVLSLLPAFSWAESPLPDTCAKTCVINAECGVGGICENNRCAYEKRFCFNERWSVNQRGESTNCDFYACSPKTGLCLRSATSSVDCLSGYVFDGNSKCIPSVQCNLAEPSCQDLYDRWKTERNEYEATTPEPALEPLSCVACDQRTDCGEGKMCWNGRCESRAAHCTVNPEGDHFSVLPLKKAPENCGNFACEKVSGLCLKDCLSNRDCRSGRMCVAGLCL